MTQPVCDFCNRPLTPETAWTCPARSFDAGTPNLDAQAILGHRVNNYSEGGWAACDGCARLIRKGERDRLTEQAAARMIAAEPELRPHRRLMLRALRELHDDFWRNREGAPRRTTPAEYAESERMAAIRVLELRDGPMRTASWVADHYAGRLA